MLINIQIIVFFKPQTSSLVSLNISRIACNAVRLEMAGEVLRQIERHCFAIERAYHHGFCGPRHLHSIDACIRNVSRVANQLRPETVDELKDSLVHLRGILLVQNEQQEQAYSAGRIYFGELNCCSE